MKSPHAIEFKGINLALTVLKASLRTADLQSLEQVLLDMCAGSPDFFDHEPTVFDLADLDGTAELDWTRLVALLRRYRINPIGVCNAGADHLAGALAAGLVAVSESEAPVRQAVRNTPEPPPPPPPVIAPPPPPLALIVDRPLRSGQQVYARGGDVILLAMVSPGAEVIADGNIHSYAPLRGRALAGASGNVEARILSTCFEAELASIAGIYRTFEPGAAKDLAGKPVQIRLVGEPDTGKQRLVVEPLLTR